MEGTRTDPAKVEAVAYREAGMDLVRGHCPRCRAMAVSREPGLRYCQCGLWLDLQPPQAAPEEPDSPPE